MKTNLFTLIFICIATISMAQVNEQDSLALVALYNSTDGPNWTCGCNENWLTTPVEEWYGIATENGRVIDITMSVPMSCPNCGLNGSIPSEIGNLTALQIIRLSSNDNLSGPIPPEIGQLDALLKLDILNCNLNGSIPSEISNMSSIEELNISDNQLTGSIPVEIGNMISLKDLNISGNQLTGSIPVEIGDLTSLIELNLSNNQLTGVIPLEVCNLSNIENLYLSNNQLTGNIPAEIGNIVSLKNLKISNNQLTGSIPPEIGNLASLNSINLSVNQLTGNIPLEIGNTNLSSLNLSNNLLSGCIPPEIGSISHLVYLYLSNNNLTGSIPPEIGNLTPLRYLYLSNNQLTGSIPPEIGNLAPLLHLYLSNNQLTGSIPSEVGNLTHLSYVYISNNQLTGEIPDDIFNVSLIKEIVLNDNSFTSIPDLSTAAQLEIFKTENNRLEFDCLEPNQSLVSIDEYTYSPQDSINIEIDTTVIVHSSITLETFCGGGNNQYQWYFNNNPIEGATGSTYTLDNVIAVNQGVYTCAVTNTVVTGLTLWRKPVTLHVNTSGIEDTNNESIIIEKSGGNLLITNLHDNCNINVYSVDGRLLLSCLGEKDEIVTVDISKFPKGVLILKIVNENDTFISKKIINY